MNQLLLKLLVPLCGAMLLGRAAAQIVPSGFQVDTLAQSGLPAPMDLTFLADGRALIGNRAGELCLYAGGPVVQIGVVPSVTTFGERGLLSIEADPEFALNGYVYVHYSGATPASLNLDRFTLIGDRSNPTSTNLAVDPASRRVVLDCVRDAIDAHNGGSARFGPDGMLYLSVGDDGSACDAQNPASGLGCIFRLDVTALPPGGSLVAPAFAQLNPGNNPLSTNVDLSQLVIAHGLRNPFRMEIDPLTGNLYVGDVGENDFEEINEYSYSPGVLPLRNYGWPWKEGSAPWSSTPPWWVPCGPAAPPGLVDPIAIGDHATTGWTALIQGPIYRNRGGVFDFGSSYEGSIFCVDYYFAWLRRFERSGSGWAPAAPVPGQPNAAEWGTIFERVTSMRQGPDGAIYVTQDVPWWAGALQRIRPSVAASQILPHSGAGQAVPANEPFPQPVVASVRDGLGVPVSGVPVDFAIFGAGSLASQGPVLTDSLGEARMFVDAGNVGGHVTVTATSAVALGAATFSLFTRKISVAHTSTLAVVTIANASAATPPPALVPFVVMVALPGVVPWSSPFGPVCTNPASPLTIVIEDGLGVFGGVSLSGAGSIGLPGLTRVYQLVPGLLTGLQLNFQAIGLDPVEGMFRTDCTLVQF